MVAAVDHQCRRLVRTSIEDMELGDLPSGHVREYEEEEFFRLLKINNWRD
jgi:23S rRNA pseudouridine2457 synthase